jgi:hypothetical protein
MPHADRDSSNANPESSHVRSAHSARSYEGMEQVANPAAARRGLPRWSSTLADHLAYRSRAPRDADVRRRLEPDL